MNELDQLLADTIRYLEQQKAAGVERVEVSPETLAELSVIPAASLQHSTLHAPRSDAATLDAAPIQNPKPSPRDAKQSKIQNSDKAKALDAIWQRARVCVKCAELAERRKNVVFGVGNPEARLVFVGEAPGEDEDIQGEPFVGRAGQLLTKIIESGMGLKRSDVYIANILKCRPPNNRKPTPDESTRCKPFLIEQLAVIQPEVIVALGATGVEGLLGLTGITKLRGNWLTYKLPSGNEILVMPTFHPAFLLRDPNQKKFVWEDMQKVMAKLGLKRPKSSALA
jgi:uracil-DNA glycosylase family 4